MYGSKRKWLADSYPYRMGPPRKLSCLISGLTLVYGGYTLWLFNIAMENGPFIDGLPIKNGDFPWLCLS